MTDRRLLSFLLAIGFAAGCGSDDMPTDRPPDPCALPSYEDDIRLSTELQADFASESFRVGTNGSRALVCGDGFIAIIDPTSASTETLTAPELAGPCGGIAAMGEDRAVVASWNGQLTLVDTGAGAPTLLQSISVAPAVLYDVAVDDGIGYVAAGDAGVLSFTIDSDQLSAGPAVGGAEDARGIATVGSAALLVADGAAPGDATAIPPGGARIRLLARDGSGVIQEQTELAGIATRVLVDGTRAIVLRPGFGFDVMDVSDTTLTLTYSTYVGRGLPYDAALRGDTLLLAAASELQRYQLGAADAQLISTEDRPDRGAPKASWFRSLAYVGETLVALTDRSLIGLELGAGEPAPELSIDQHTFSLAEGQQEALLLFSNTGTAPMIVSGVEADAPFAASIATDLGTPRDGCPGQFVVEPNASLAANYSYSGDPSWQQGTLRIRTDDADEPELTAALEAYRPVPSVGDSIEGFALPDVRGYRFDNKQVGGKIILAKLYNPL